MIPYTDLSAKAVAPADQRIPYGSEALQFGELRLPSGSDKAPLVVLVHGGCWQAEYDLKHLEGAAAALVKEGFATWMIEYRRVGDAGGGWPGTFDDVSRGVDYVHTLATQFPRIDSTRIVLMGHSAGGQLVTWLGSRKQLEHTGIYVSSMPPLSVAGVVSLAGISDLATYGAGKGGCNGAVTPLMGGTPAQVADRYRAVSPIERVPIGVPVHLIHGSADPIVPISQSRDFAARDSAAGGSVQLHIVEGAGHFDLVSPDAEAWSTVIRVLHSIVDRAPEARVHVGS